MAERMAHLLAVQAVKSPRGYGGADRAGSRRLVIAPRVMRPPQRGAEPAGGLGAQRERGQKVGQLRAFLLRSGDGGGQDGRRQMPHMAEMRRRPIRQRGGPRRTLSAADQSGDRRAALGEREFPDDPAGRLIESGARDDHPVEQRKTGEALNGRRKIARVQRRDVEQQSGDG